MVPVPDDQLPVRLPDVVEFTGRGESPLAHVPEFVNTACP
jgi:leucyl-tRNA synthetase